MLQANLFLRRLELNPRKSTPTTTNHNTKVIKLLFNLDRHLSIRYVIYILLSLRVATIYFPTCNIFCMYLVCVASSLLSNVCDNFSLTSALSQWLMHLRLLQLLLLVISWYVMPGPIKRQLYILIDNVLFPYAILMTSAVSEVTKYRVTYLLFQTINALSSV